MSWLSGEGSAIYRKVWMSWQRICHRIGEIVTKGLTFTIRFGSTGSLANDLPFTIRFHLARSLAMDLPFTIRFELSLQDSKINSFVQNDLYSFPKIAQAWRYGKPSLSGGHCLLSLEPTGYSVMDLWINGYCNDQRGFLCEFPTP